MIKKLTVKEANYYAREGRKGYIKVKHIFEEKQGKQIVLGLYLCGVLEYLAMHSWQFSFWFIFIPTYYFVHRILFSKK